MEPVSNTTIRSAIEAIETRILLATPTDLGLVKAATLKGTRVMPSQRASVGVAVTRDSTRNLGLTRNQTVIVVEDIIVVTLQRRVTPKDQLTGTRAAIWDKAQAVTNRVTKEDFVPNITLVFQGERDVEEGEWMKVIQRYTTRRQMEVGAG